MTSCKLFPLKDNRHFFDLPSAFVSSYCHPDVVSCLMLPGMMAHVGIDVDACISSDDLVIDG
jgi:hypothetical protein